MPDKIRIRLLTQASGPHFQLAPGVHDVDREQGEAMVAGGFAELVAAEEASPEPSVGPDVVETATAPPQRSREADELLAAERAGRAAAEAGEDRKNPYDGRSALGKAWARGFDSYGQEHRVPKQG